MKSTAWPRSTSAWPTAHIAWLLPTPGQAEGQHIGRLLEEVALGELVQPAHERRRASALRRACQTSCRAAASTRAAARDAALVSLLRFELQHLEQQRQRRLLLRLDEPRHQLARGGREREPVSRGA
jgi:hypothetical protein